MAGASRSGSWAHPLTPPKGLLTPPAMNPRVLKGLAILAIVALAGWGFLSVRYTFASGSRVWVEGTSTVHDWTCEAGRVSATLDGTPGSGSLTEISALNLTIPVAQMDCKNRTMNGKLRNALGTAPIRFALTNARVGNVRNGVFAIDATGRLTIKGRTRTQRVTAQGRALSGGRFRITGDVAVTMSQFGVDPPRALAGTLRTGDRTTVRFDVIAAR